MSEKHLDELVIVALICVFVFGGGYMVWKYVTGYDGSPEPCRMVVMKGGAR